MNIEKLVMNTVKTLAVLLIVGVSGVVKAQTVTLTATPTSAIGSTPVTLTWATTPAAMSCTASGDWTGAKAASGTTTLAAITASKSYTLTCTFPTSAAVQLQWVSPVTNTDNSPLTNLASYKVYFGTSATTLSQTQASAGTGTTATVPSLSAGTWFFAVTAISATGKESAKSNVVTKAVPALVASATAPVTVTPDTTPNPPANLTVVEALAYDVILDESRYVATRGRSVGKAAIGAACDEGRTTGTGFYALERPSRVRLTRQPRSSSLVARCGEATARHSSS